MVKHEVLPNQTVDLVHDHCCNRTVPDLSDPQMVAGWNIMSGPSSAMATARELDIWNIQMLPTHSPSATCPTEERPDSVLKKGCTFQLFKWIFGISLKHHWNIMEIIIGISLTSFYIFMFFFHICSSPWSAPYATIFRSADLAQERGVRRARQSRGAPPSLSRDRGSAVHHGWGGWVLGRSVPQEEGPQSQETPGLGAKWDLGFDRFQVWTIDG